MNKFYGVEYYQAGQRFISLVVPISYVIKNSEVLIYGEDKKYGYQRGPKKEHYYKIAKGLLEEDCLVSPSSIILGINSDDLEKKFEVKYIGDGEEKATVLTPINGTEGIKLLIIDGQHRIKGFETAIEKATGEKEEILKSYKVNVILMLLDPHHRLPEVQVFSDINSKAKPLKMDLTMLAEYQYQLLEQPKDANYYNYLKTRVIKKLIDGNDCRGWMNGIIVDVNAESKTGSVGYKTFAESIEPLCMFFLDPYKSEVEQEVEFMNRKAILDKVADIICTECSKCWNYIFEKWNVLDERKIVINDEEYTIYYNLDFYVQRTMGVVAINKIICREYKEGRKYAGFEKLIKNSALTTSDWRTNGLFAGLNSLSGAKRIEETIKQQ